MVMPSLAVIQIVSLLVVLLCARYLLRWNRPPLPPGPRGWPLIGNSFDIPTHTVWQSFAQMGEKWGDLLSLTTLGKTIIIINSFEVAEDLLESRGSNFSDRPFLQMGGELVGFRNTITFSQYGERVRKERKLFHQLFGTSMAIERFLPLLRSEIHKFLQNLLLNPDGAVGETQRTAAAVMMRIAYGYRIAAERDPFLELFGLRAKIFAESTESTALVNLFPLVRYLPAWLPGGRFRTTANKWAKVIQDSVNGPLGYVKDQMAAGTAEHSFSSALLQEQPDDDYLVKWAASSIYGAGTSTTSSQLEGFFLAMSLYPDVQAEAQRELDLVIGKDRLPEISGRPDLPYMNALCKEVLRWHSANPTGIPHRTREDLIYDRKEGHPPVLIPKDSVIIPNIWYMTHDPKRYSDPMTFNPRRFLNTGAGEAELDPSKICFGYGRRICAGKLFADTFIFLICSTVLSLFNINKASKNGVVVEPAVGQTSGTVSRPLPFACTVVPRGDETRSLIELTRGVS
ncbi:cytochrome P450 [Mycena sanguinolenta]|nr:cytochrome P450 [Mycena sanguinolenta]